MSKRPYRASIAWRPVCFAVLLMWHPTPGRADWLRDAMKGWKAIEDMPRPCYWVLRNKNGTPGKSKLLYTVSKRRGGQFVHFLGEFNDRDELPDDLESHANSVFARNNDYVFRLRRRSGESPWIPLGIVENQRLNDRNKDPAYRWSHELLSSFDNLEAWAPVLFRHSVLLSEFFSSPSVHVKEAGPVEKNGKRLFKVSFAKDRSPEEYFPKSKASYVFEAHGEVLLDPEHNWRLEHVVSTLKLGADGKTVRTYVDTYTYDPETERILAIKSVFKDWVMRMTFLDRRFDCDYDDAMFRLPAFGIPEPAELKPKANWWRWYVLAGMIGTVLIIAGLKLRRR